MVVRALFDTFIEIIPRMISSALKISVTICLFINKI